MKRRKENTAQTLGRFLGRFFSPSSEQVEAAGSRVLQRLHEKAGGASECAALEPESIRPVRNAWGRAATLAAIAVALVVVSVMVWRKQGPDVVASSADGRAYTAGELLRSNESGSTAVTLADGSHVEIRAGSEAAVERAVDGLRVRLNAGSIIVNAAKQAAGRHLYVSTRDVLVSVVGTVFLVNADEKGSDVAVIQGEVHVKQGAVEKDLRRGEQASSRSNPELAIAVKIGWSREAAAYLAMLHQEIAQSVAARQAAPTAPAVPVEVPKAPQFEEASIKPCPKDFQAPEGMRGGGSNSMRLSPGRLDALCMTVATLIRTAYRTLNNNEMPGMRESTLRMNLTAGLGMEDGTRGRAQHRGRELGFETRALDIGEESRDLKEERATVAGTMVGLAVGGNTKRGRSGVRVLTWR
ncbi:MAG TPA: FecR domain-containing protein [Terriglobia bacterium]|jgi:ferric-dicitrate binding protein FerR (iron transport regulator)